MAKVQAAVAGQNFTFQANETENAMWQVIAEVKRRVEGVRLRAQGDGTTELLVLTLLEAVAELMQVNTVAVLSESEVHALQARLQYLEDSLQYSQAIEQAKQSAKAVLPRKSARVQARQKRRDFQASQIEMQI